MAKDPISFMFQQQMGMVLLNPTNEDFDMQFSGVSFTIKAGEKLTMAENAAKHVLNSFGQRGLSYLAFGADEERIAADGKQRNREFKIKQVTEFNIRNENRKNMNLGYLPPSDKIKEYASEMGIELMQPYAPRDAERVKLNAQDDEITALRRSNADLADKVNKLLELVMTDKKPEPSGEKPFHCKYPGCGSSFSTTIALTGHKRSHPDYEEIVKVEDGSS